MFFLGFLVCLLIKPKWVTVFYSFFETHKNKLSCYGSLTTYMVNDNIKLIFIINQLQAKGITNDWTNR